MTIAREMEPTPSPAAPVCARGPHPVTDPSEWIGWNERKRKYCKKHRTEAANRKRRQRTRALQPGEHACIECRRPLGEDLRARCGLCLEKARRIQRRHVDRKDTALYCQTLTAGVDPFENGAPKLLLRRFKRLRLLLHPDKCTDPRAAQAFIRLNEFWERHKPVVLSDTARSSA